MTRDWTEELIAAHVDGSLDAREDAAVRRAIETDPEARSTAERLRRLNSLLGEAYPAPGSDIPDRIAAALGAEPDRVVPVTARRRPQWLPLAAAAAIALAVGIGAAAMLSRDGASSRDPVLADAGPALEQALETLASGTLSEAGIRPLSTFRETTGRPCREFETGAGAPARSGIACRVPGGIWEIMAVMALPDAGDDSGGGYAPASAPEDEALGATLDALGAGMPLSPEEEAALIRSGWR